MSGNEILVVITTLFGVALVNWFFFGAKGATQAVMAAGVQEVTIAVKGGYSPSVIRVQSGAPIRLVFDRQETSGCSEEVVFPDFGIKKYLPAFEQTTIELLPTAPGTFDFTCGMSMLHGKLIVE